MYDQAVEEEWAIRMAGPQDADDRCRLVELRKLIAKLELALDLNDEPGGRLHRAER